MNDRIEKIMKNSQAIIFYWKAEETWPVDFVSQNISMLGYSDDDFLSGRVPYASIVYPADLARVTQEVQEYTAKGIDQFSQEYRIIDASGKVHWIDDRTVIERDKNGNAIYYLGTIIDISDRKLLERERNQQHRFVQGLLDGLDDNVMVIRTDYSIEWMNKSAREKANVADVADPSCPKCYEVSHHRSTPCDSVDHPCPLREVQATGKAVSVIHNHGDKFHDHYVKLVAKPLRNEQDQIYAIVESAHDITEMVQTQEALKEKADLMTYQASHDDLTGLPNRQMFADLCDKSIARASRLSAMMAVVFIDVDSFKAINDNYGHQAGDDVLVRVAERMKSCLRVTDTVARLSGDEFILLIEGVNQRSEVTVVMDKLMRLFDTPIDTSAGTVEVSLSSGVAVYPQNGTDRKTLVRHADLALYDVKSHGRKGYRFFDEIDSDTDK